VADTDGVSIVFSTEGTDELLHAVSNIESKLDELGKTATNSLGANLVTAANQAIDLFQKIASAMKDAAMEGVDFNATIEKAELSIAGLIATFNNFSGGDKWKAAFDMAREADEKLIEAAQRTGVSIESMSSGFEKLYGVATTKGKASTDEILQLTESIATYAQITGSSVDAAASQFTRVLNGVISQRSAIGQFLMSLGVTKETILSWEAQGVAVTKLTSLLGDFQKLAPQIANTWQGVTQNLKTATEMAFGSMTGQLFQPIKDAIKDLTTWLKSDDVQSAMKTIGSDLVDAFRAIEPILKELGPIALQVAGGFAAILKDLSPLAPIFLSIADAANSLLKALGSEGVALIGALLLGALAFSKISTAATAAIQSMKLVNALDFVGLNGAALAATELSVKLTAVATAAELATAGLVALVIALPAIYLGFKLLGENSETLDHAQVAAENLRGTMIHLSESIDPTTKQFAQLQALMSQLAAAMNSGDPRAISSAVDAITPKVTALAREISLLGQKHTETTGKVAELTDAMKKALESFAAFSTALGNSFSTAGLDGLLKSFAELDQKAEDTVEKIANALLGLRKQLGYLPDDAMKAAQALVTMNQIATEVNKSLAEGTAVQDFSDALAAMSRQIDTDDPIQKIQDTADKTVQSLRDDLTKALKAAGDSFYDQIVAYNVFWAAVAAADDRAGQDMAERYLVWDGQWGDYLNLMMQKNYVVTHNIALAWQQALGQTADVMTKTAVSATEGINAALTKLLSDIGSDATIAGQAITSLGSQLQSTLSSSFFDVITGKFSDLTNVFKKFGEDILKDLTDIFAKLVERWLLTVLLIKDNPIEANVDSGGGSGGGLGGLAQTAFGSGGGGSQGIFSRLGLGGGGREALTNPDGTPTSAGYAQMYGAPQTSWQGGGITGAAGFGLGMAGIGMGVSAWNSAQNTGQKVGAGMEVTGGAALMIGSAVAMGVNAGLITIGSALQSIIGIGTVIGAVLIAVGLLINLLSKPKDPTYAVSGATEILPGPKQSAFGADIYASYGNTLSSMQSIVSAGGGGKTSIYDYFHGGAIPDEFLKSTNPVFDIGHGDQGTANMQQAMKDYLNIYFPKTLESMAFGQKVTGYSDNKGQTPGVTNIPLFESGSFDPNAPIPKMLEGLGVTANKIHDIAKLIDQKDPQDFLTWLNTYVNVVSTANDLISKMSESGAQTLSDLTTQATQPYAKTVSTQNQALIDQVNDALNAIGDDQITKAQDVEKAIQQQYQQELQYIDQVRQMMDSIDESTANIKKGIADALKSQADLTAEQTQDVSDMMAKIPTETDPNQIQKDVTEAQNAIQALAQTLITQIQNARALQATQKDVSTLWNMDRWLAPLDVAGQRMKDLSAIQADYAKAQTDTGQDQLNDIAAVQQAVRDRYAYEVQLISSIHANMDALAKSIEQQKQGLTTALMTQEQLTAYQQTQLALAKSAISGATTPDQVAAATQQAQAAITSLANTLIAQYQHAQEVQTSLAATSTQWGSARYTDPQSIAQSTSQFQIDLQKKLDAATKATGEDQLNDIQEINDAVASRYQAEVQMIATIKANVKALDQSIADQKYGLQFAGATPEQQKAMMQQQMSGLLGQIGSAGTAEDLKGITDKFQALISQYMGNFKPGDAGYNEAASASEKLLDQLQAAADAQYKKLGDQATSDKGSTQNVLDAAQKLLVDNEKKASDGLADLSKQLDDLQTSANAKYQSLIDDATSDQADIQTILDGVTGLLQTNIDTASSKINDLNTDLDTLDDLAKTTLTGIVNDVISANADLVASLKQLNDAIKDTTTDYTGDTGDNNGGGGGGGGGGDDGGTGTGDGTPADSTATTTTTSTDSSTTTSKGASATTKKGASATTSKGASATTGTDGTTGSTAATTVAKTVTAQLVAPIGGAAADLAKASQSLMDALASAAGGSGGATVAGSIGADLLAAKTAQAGGGTGPGTPAETADMQAALDKMATPVSGAATDLAKATQDLMDKVSTPVSGAATDLAAATQDLMDKVSTPVAGAAADLSTAAQQMLDAMKEQQDAAKKAGGGDASGGLPGLGSAGGALGSSLPPVMQSQNTISMSVDVSSGTPEEIAAEVGSQLKTGIGSLIVQMLQKNNLDMVNYLRMHPELLRGQ